MSAVMRVERGTVLVYRVFDVAQSIDLQKLEAIPQAQTGAFKSTYNGQTYGTPPMWSSCPCVSKSAEGRGWHCSRYVRSGISKSTPGRSGPANITPASMTRVAPSVDTAIEFMPNSPSPPSGTTCRVGAISNRDTSPGAGVPKKGLTPFSV